MDDPCAGRWWSGAGQGWPAPASTTRSRRGGSGRGPGPRPGTGGASFRSPWPTTPGGRGRRPSSARSCGTGRWTGGADRRGWCTAAPPPPARWPRGGSSRSVRGWTASSAPLLPQAFCHPDHRVGGAVAVGEDAGVQQVDAGGAGLVDRSMSFTLSMRDSGTCSRMPATRTVWGSMTTMASGSLPAAFSFSLCVTRWCIRVDLPMRVRAT